MIIRLKYQVKKTFRDRYEVCVLEHVCDSSKSDRENLDDAFDKACSMGCDPNKNIMWNFIK